MKQYPNIDAIIEDSDTKVQDLAKVIGVSTKQIRRWRDGTSEMGIEKLEKLCRYYHVSADYILGLPRDLELSLIHISIDLGVKVVFVIPEICVR